MQHYYMSRDVCMHFDLYIEQKLYAKDRSSSTAIMLRKWSVKRLAYSVGDYMLMFFNKSGIHGFFYFSNMLLTILEKYSWILRINE